jgi:hypothetical protein
MSPDAVSHHSIYYLQNTIPAYPLNIQNPNAEEGQEELQLNAMSLEELKMEKFKPGFRMKKTYRPFL